MTPQEAHDFIIAKSRHKFYKDTVTMAYDLSIHADGEPPKDIITARRPKESKEIQAYRETIYVSKTEAPVFKVFNSLMKIRKSQDWMIKYSKNHSKIADKETLEQYMEKDFPKYSSFTNWFFAICFKQYLIDANAVSFLMPENLLDNQGAYEVEETNEYLEPYPVIYNSHQILDYSQDHYLLHSAEKNIYTKGKSNNEGDIFYLVDSNSIYEFKEIDPKPEYTITTYAHNLGELPVVKLGGWVKKELKNLCLYKSRISPMLPELKEAVREYSDLQAEIVQHIHSTLWAIESQKCNTCSGSGKVISGKDAAPIKCKDCKGRGFYPFNPYENFIVRAPKAGESASPTPPVGYIQKQIEIAKLQNERVQDHIYYALAAINCEFLTSTPLNQSGKAKQVDRSEIDNFVHSVAEDIIRIFDDHYSISNNYRNRIIVPNQDERETLLPFINVPIKYDILSEEFLVDEVAKARQSSINKAILNACEIEYANKKFGADDDIRNFVISCIELDPFASEAEDMIILKLTNGGISKQKYIIHCNIKEFIRRAINEVNGFYDLSYADKEKTINKYADEVIKENSASGRVLSMIQGGKQTVPSNNNNGYNIGDNVKIIAGKEKIPAHADMPMTVAGIQSNGTYNLKASDGSTALYNVNDLMAA